jgi:hypothetical protein
MRRSRRLLAASFVATFAAGCDAKSPAPAGAVTVEVPAPSSASPAASGSVSPVPAAGSERPLAPAPSSGRVNRNEDGTCTWFADVHCPHSTSGRVIPCNPPRPRQVLCPPDAGASGGAP